MPGEAKDPKRFGMVSLGLILQATGLKLIVVDDQQTLAKVLRMYVKRDTTQVRLNNDCRRPKGHKKPKPAAKRRISGTKRRASIFSFILLADRVPRPLP